MQKPYIHPGVSLHWKRCANLPEPMGNAQAVLLESILYVGGGLTSGNSAIIYTCELTVETWSTLPTPVQLFALTTYQSQLVLAGGKLASSDHTTNELWELGKDRQTWNQPFPPMQTARRAAFAVSSDNHLVVAGGCGGDNKNVQIVEVYDGLQWVQTDPLPMKCRYIKSSCCNNTCYLIGGEGQARSVSYSSLQLLVHMASHQPIDCSRSFRARLLSFGRGSRTPPSSHTTDEQQSVWKTLPDVPFDLSSTTILGGAILTVGGLDMDTLIRSSFIHMYSPLTQTWEKVSELPEAVSSTCSITLPNGEIVVIGGSAGPLSYSAAVYKATLNPQQMTSNVTL